MFHRDVLFYAEDDAGYADLLKISLKRAGLDHQLIHVSDGEQALAYFKGEGQYADRQKFPLPTVALLDIKMPRVNGFELLKWIREESPFPYLPVVVLTVSEEIRDISKAYKLGANSFLVKPTTALDLKEMLKMLENYWLKHNLALPPQSA